jgi:hypothetical protein
MPEADRGSHMNDALIPEFALSGSHLFGITHAVQGTTEIKAMHGQYSRSSHNRTCQSATTGLINAGD